jgi:hypothetical protein
MAHNQLHNFVRLYIQHDRRRVPTNHYTLINHHQLIQDTTAVVHNQFQLLNPVVILHIQHDRRCLPANHHALNDQLVIFPDLGHEHVLHEWLRTQVCGLDR